MSGKGGQSLEIKISMTQSAYSPALMIILLFMMGALILNNPVMKRVSSLFCLLIGSKRIHLRELFILKAISQFGVCILVNFCLHLATSLLKVRSILMVGSLAEIMEQLFKTNSIQTNILMAIIQIESQNL